MKLKKEYSALGIMSGTSLDGIDFAYCHLKNQNAKWHFEIKETTTIKYNQSWKKTLSNANHLSAYKLIKLNREYGEYIGTLADQFLKSNKIQVDFIASHGHTIFHEPGKKINFQLGDGANIAATTGITTISDFRSLDICLGGQGAPLVPIGDELLFPEFDFCINLGGFANISHYDENKTRVAYDIVPTNIVLNALSQKLGFEFDENGRIGREGVVEEQMLKRLNNIAYFKQKPPKSIGTEWLNNFVSPILESEEYNVTDKLRTFYEHISHQIAKSITFQNQKAPKKALITGGGALNSFLIEQIRAKTDIEIVVPDNIIVNYKEALIFAFLGVLRLKETSNCLKSVTGAQFDNIGGAVYFIR